MTDKTYSLYPIDKGALPSHWNFLPIGAVIDVAQYGTNAPSSNEGNTPVVGMKDISGGKIFTDQLSAVDLDKNEQKKFLLGKGDLLLNRTNSYDLVGKIGIYDSDKKAAFVSYLVRLKVNIKKADTWYVNYWLNSYPAQKTIKRIATRAISQANINPTEFKKHCYIPLPPKNEQEKIAACLSTWDTAIEKTERLIAAKEAVKKGLMQRLLTGKKRLPCFTEPWHEFRLGDLFKERSERANNHLPLLSITREEGVIPREDVGRKDTSNADKSKYLRICPGDIGYNTMRMWQGVSALSAYEGIVSPAYTIATPKKGVDGEFIAYLFKLPKPIHLFYRYSQGLTSDTWNLKFHHFSEIKVTIPDIEEQKAIARVLKTCDAELSLLRNKLAALQKQKRGLMQKLLTGQWLVKAPKAKEVSP